MRFRRRISIAPGLRLNLSRIEFGNLAAIDPIQALTTFQLRRNMTRTGVFSPVEPYR